MKSTDALGRYKIDFIPSKREKKINGNVTKSGNQVMSHGKSQRTTQLCIKKKGVQYRR